MVAKAADPGPSPQEEILTQEREADHPGTVEIGELGIGSLTRRPREDQREKKSSVILNAVLQKPDFSRFQLGL
jgi:hypothetical protein